MVKKIAGAVLANAVCAGAVLASATPTATHSWTGSETSGFLQQTYAKKKKQDVDGTPKACDYTIKVDKFCPWSPETDNFSITCEKFKEDDCTEGAIKKRDNEKNEGSEKYMENVKTNARCASCENVC